MDSKAPLSSSSSSSSSVSILGIDSAMNQDSLNRKSGELPSSSNGQLPISPAVANKLKDSHSKLLDRITALEMRDQQEEEQLTKLLSQLSSLRSAIQSSRIAQNFGAASQAVQEAMGGVANAAWIHERVFRTGDLNEFQHMGETHSTLSHNSNSNTAQNKSNQDQEVGFQSIYTSSSNGRSYASNEQSAQSQVLPATNQQSNAAAEILRSLTTTPTVSARGSPVNLIFSNPEVAAAIGNIAQVSLEEFDSLIHRLRNSDNPTTREDIIRVAADNYMFTCRQTGVILSSLRYSSEKEVAACALSRRLIDWENAAEIVLPLLGNEKPRDKQRILTALRFNR